MLVQWLINRLEAEEHEELDIKYLYDLYCFEMKESGDENVCPGIRVFLNYFTSIYPHVEKYRKRQGKSIKTMYKGIALKPLPPLNITETICFQDIESNICSPAEMDSVSETCITCKIHTECKKNDNNVVKLIKFQDNKTWSIEIGQKKINLDKLNIENKYIFTSESIKNVIRIAQSVQLCTGVFVKGATIVSKCEILEIWKDSENSNGIRAIRSIYCEKVVVYGSTTKVCKTCQNMSKLKAPKSKSENSHSEGNKNFDQIQKLLKYANPELINLLLEQSKNVSREPTGRRWSKHFLGTCLQIYNKSPKAYQSIIDSKILLLPSPSTLILYRSKIKQKPGFDEEIFEWMYNEANEHDISKEGRQGGLIFDEMSIQSDIQIEKNGDIVEIIGFIDEGKEGDICNVLRTGKKDKPLGSHIMQMMFLGINGFRFPFAHFVTHNIQGSELFAMFWKAVQLLYSYGFLVLYTCMDGAVCNRSLLHLNVGENKNFNYNFICKSPSSPQYVIFIMDVSHVLKKIRNNIIKSGMHEKCTRTLTLPNQFTIQWQMFIDCFKWDQQNALQLHRKLTSEHIYPDGQLKMRNYLAEDVLNSNMLYAMQQYKQTLGEKGTVLNGCIDFLEQTSELVSIFRDMRPIKDKEDIRLKKLNCIADWFLCWAKDIYKDNSIPQNKKNKCLLSLQCVEDIQSCIHGFLSLCDCVLKCGTMFVTPALINSDVIENVFNQQRSTYNGANTNPNAYQYRKTINNIVLGQSSISSKSNAGKDISKSTIFTTDKPSRKRTAKNPHSDHMPKIKNLKY